MKKIISTILIITTLLSTMAFITFPASISVSAESYEPEGTPIGSIAELKNVKSNGKYYLTTNLTLPADWAPIGETYEGFKDFTLDGKDKNGVVHTITFAGTNPLFKYAKNATIKNLNLAGTMDYDSANKAGWRESPLFSGGAQDPKLQNITSSVNIKVDQQGTSEPISGLANWVIDTGGTLIENCTYTGTITLNGYVKGVGGMVGLLNAQNESGTKRGAIRNCTNLGTFTFNANYFAGTNGGSSVGGIVGNIWSGVKVDNPEGTDNVYYGGGYIDIENCVNGAKGDASKGKISVATVSSGDLDADYFFAGIAGRINNGAGVTIKDCINYASVDQDRSFNWGGIVGYLDRISSMYVPHHVIDGCENHGDFTFDVFAYKVAGIATLIGDVNSTIKNCTNYGDITFKSTLVVGNHESTGGIVSRVWHQNSAATGTPGVNPKLEAKILNCTNYGNITLEDGVKSDSSAGNGYDYHTGGILGRIYQSESVRIDGCVNKGDITVNCSVSGISAGRWHSTGGIVGTVITSVGTCYLSVTNTQNFGNVSAKLAGGILGATYQLYKAKGHKIRIDISHCYNSGTITGINSGAWDSFVANNNNNGDAGGIIGAMDQGESPGGELHVSYCVNDGNIRGGRFAGGILAVRTNITNNEYGAQVPDPSYIDNCVNRGKIETKSGSYYYAAGGIVSSAKGYFKITSCVNDGDLAAKEGGNGHTNAPIANFQENQWESVVEGCHYSATGIGSWAASGSGNHYQAFCENDMIAGASGWNDADLESHANVAAKIQAMYEGTDEKLDGSLKDQIITVSDFKHFYKYNAGARHFVLGSDMTLSSSDVYPKILDGITFDGNGYTVTTKSYEVANLFDRVTNSTLKNVKFARAGSDNFENDDMKAPLAGEVGGTMLIENVSSDSSYWAPSQSGTIKHTCVGGLIGSLGIDNMTNNVTVRDCKHSGWRLGRLAEDRREVCVGGIAGHILVGSPNDVFLIENCQNSGSGVISNRAGGIIGGICTNDRMSTTDGTTNKDGNFKNAKVTIRNCTNSARVMGFAIAGGIVGDATDRSYLAQEADFSKRNGINIPLPEILIENCTNTGDVCAFGRPSATDGNGNALAYNVTGGYGNSALALAGGIVAATDGHITVKDCVNSGKVSNLDYACYVYTASSSDLYYPCTSMKFESNNHHVSSQTGGRSDGGIYNYLGTADAFDYKISYAATEYIDAVGGIIGAKIHQSYSRTDNNTGVVIENCKNAGDVTGPNNSIGGILGYSFVGNLDIKRCVNMGHVLTFGSKGNTAYAAGGILGVATAWGGTNYEGHINSVKYSESTYKINIEKCVNAGKVELVVAAYRDADVWKMACGIVGPCTTGIRIVDCVHVGTLEDNAPWWNSTFPITNPHELKWAFPDTDYTIPGKNPYDVHEWANNYYSSVSVLDRTWDEENEIFLGIPSVDTVLTTSSSSSSTSQTVGHHYGKHMYMFSTEASDEQLKLALKRADVYLFDSEAYLREQIAFAEWVADPAYNWRGLNYTQAQKDKIMSELAKAKALVGNATGIRTKQNTIYDQEQALREAIMDYNSAVSWEIFIPEQLPTNAEAVVTANLNNFAYYEGLMVTMNGDPNNRKLTNVDDSTKTIPYKVWHEGEALPGDIGYLLFSKEMANFAEIKKEPNAMLVYNAAGMKRSLICQVNKDAYMSEEYYGIYKDSVTFRVEKRSLENLYEQQQLNQ